MTSQTKSLKRRSILGFFGDILKSKPPTDILSTEVEIWLTELSVWEQLRHRSNLTYVYKVTFSNGSYKTYRIGFKEKKYADPNPTLLMYMKYLDINLSITLARYSTGHINHMRVNVILKLKDYLRFKESLSFFSILYLSTKI